MQNYHIPVMVNEVVKNLAPEKGGIYVDATLGGGGHSLEIVKKLKNKGKLVCMDRDPDAIAAAKLILEGQARKIVFVNDDFQNIKKMLADLKIEKIDGILFDLGVSSHQIDSPERGFSLRADGPLDMRMDKTRSLTAKIIVNDYSPESIAKIIFEFGEERLSRKIARAIEEKRKVQAIATTKELVEVIEAALKGLPPKVKFDAVTRVFQALRIAVNDELDQLLRALKDSIDILNKKGRIVVISYHSLEDRIVKTVFKEGAISCICPPRDPICSCKHKAKLKVLTKKPVIAADSEISSNPRARSAKLRAAERI